MSMSLRSVFLPPLRSAISDSSIVRTMYNYNTIKTRIAMRIFEIFNTIKFITATHK